MGVLEVSALCLGASFLIKYLVSENESIPFPENNSQEIDTKTVDIMTKYKEFFDFLMPYPLTKEQRLAVVDNSPRSLVVASAGSGKTSILEAKYGFLVESLEAKPSEILVLAFNSSVKEEVKKRISNNPNIRGGEPRVETFHSYGRSMLLENGESVDIDEDSKEDIGKLIPSKLIEKLIKKAQKKNPEIHKKIQDFRVLCPRLSIMQLAETEDEYKQILSEYPYKREFGRVGEENREISLPTIDGKFFVKSQEELLIANYLIVNGINFEYEKKFPISDYPYHPDFYFPDIEMWHEHFAIRKDNTSPFTGYIKEADAKKKLHKESKSNILYTYSHQYQDNTIIDILDKRLADEGIEKKPLSQKKIDGMIKKIYIDELFSLIKQALNLYKSSQLTKAKIEIKYDKLDDRFRATRFKEILLPIQEAYEEHLKNNGTIDYEDMIKKATHIINAASRKQNYKFILVDEFQDVSISRANFLHAILKNNMDSKLFAVGDDWQSIYRFAGSDLSVMPNFGERFYSEDPSGASIYCIQKTHRFPQSIADLSSFFIQKNPEQIPKKIVAHASKKTSDIHFCEMVDYSDKTVLQLLNDVPVNDNKVQSVYILGRRKADTADIDILYLSKKRPDLKFEKSTIHKVKGLEKNITVILGLDTGAFPYVFGDDPLLEVFLPRLDSYKYSEERRVMYVAMTRSFEHVYMASKYSKKESPFKLECKNICDENKISYTEHMYGGESVKPCMKCNEKDIAGGMVVKTTKVTRGKKPNVFLSCNMFSHFKYPCRESDFNYVFCPTCYSNGGDGELICAEGVNSKLIIRCDVCSFSDDYCNYHKHYKSEAACRI